MKPAEANEYLYAATEKDNLSLLNEAIDAGADTEHKSPKTLKDKRGATYMDRRNGTSLHVACLRGFMPIFLRLLEINARVNARTLVSLV